MMTVSELISNLAVLPSDCKVMSNSGWEVNETNIGAMWYSASLNQVHLTQGFDSEITEGYKPGFLMIYHKGVNE